jgi:hypothetical protein
MQMTMEAFIVGTSTDAWLQPPIFVHNNNTLLFNQTPISIHRIVSVIKTVRCHVLAVEERDIAV